MPEDLAEALITILGVLFIIIIPLILRIRNAGQRRRQPGAPHPGAAGLPEAQEEPEAEPTPLRQEPALPPTQPALGLQLPVQPGPSAPTLEQPGLRFTERLPGRLQRFWRLTPWQRAVVWAEILGPPRGLDGEPPVR